MALGESFGEFSACALGEKFVLQAPGDEDGAGEVGEAAEVAGLGEVGFVGRELTDDLHEAEAHAGVGEVGGIEAAEDGIEAGFVGVADVFNATDEFFGWGEGHHEFADDGDFGHAVHFGEGLGKAGGVGEGDAVHAARAAAYGGGDHERPPPRRSCRRGRFCTDGVRQFARRRWRIPCTCWRGRGGRPARLKPE